MTIGEKYFENKDYKIAFQYWVIEKKLRETCQIT